MKPSNLLLAVSVTVIGLALYALGLSAAMLFGFIFDPSWRLAVGCFFTFMVSIILGGAGLAIFGDWYDKR